MELSKVANRSSFEGILLFFVLFFPAIYASGFSGRLEPIEVIPFSTIRELTRTLTYSLPSLALLWYLASDRGALESMYFSNLKLKTLRKKDFFTFFVCFPGLILINISVSTLLTIVSHAYGLDVPPKIGAPTDSFGWMAMVFSCLGTGYLEESYFRYYLLTKLRRTLPKPMTRVFLSTFLFSICHIYEGLWGILNAALAGFFLSVIFIRYRSLHGIAGAHAAHNIFVYTLGLFTN